MRRTLAILCFSPEFPRAAPVRGQGIEAAQQQFVEAFLSARKGEDQEKTGDLKSALVTYRSALETLKRIKQENPNWQADLLDFRLKRTMEAIDRVQEKVGGGAMKPAASDPDLLPPLDPEDPLNTKAGFPPPPRREARRRKPRRSSIPMIHSPR